MAEAEPVIRAVLPDANVPTSIRSSGVPVVHGPSPSSTSIVDAWLAEHPEGIACVIGAPAFERDAAGAVADAPSCRRVSSSTWSSWSTRSRSATGIEGAVDRYVAMTRATQQLVVLAG